ncbi:MAG: hypothetical protein Q8P01_02850 [bacterium]|nr:hypothetical protein [bacterium]
MLDHNAPGVTHVFGDVYTLSGGTRNAVKLGRPWQKELPSEWTCPFHPPKPDQVVARFGDGEWLLLTNLFTPHPFHQLIVPGSCWPSSTLRSLGGVEAVTGALTVACGVAEQQNQEVFILCHVGYGGGQNVPCHHWHVHTRSDFFTSTLRVQQVRQTVYTSPFHLSTVGEVRISVCGARTGQCFFAPSNPVSFRQVIADVAHVLVETVKLYNAKFQSTQGMSPDFSIGLKIGAQGELFYGDYAPDLAVRGAPMAFYDGSPEILAWPHEVTYAHLLSPSP